MNSGLIALRCTSDGPRFQMNRDYEATLPVAEQAADWLERLPDADAREGEDFLRWLRQSPVHARELFLAVRTAERLKHLDRRRLQRRKFHRAGKAECCATADAYSSTSSVAKISATKAPDQQSMDHRCSDRLPHSAHDRDCSAPRCFRQLNFDGCR